MLSDIIAAMSFAALAVGALLVFFVITAALEHLLVAAPFVGFPFILFCLFAFFHFLINH
jgi:hypothetical protein